MPIAKVTTRAVDTIEPVSSDVFLWDSELAGFGVRVTSGGAKSCIYQYRLGGRGSATRRYTIGRHRSPWTAQTARTKAQRLARQVQKGKDPAAKRRERRRKEVELRFDRYVELFTEGYLKHRWADWERTQNMLVLHAVPGLGTKKLSEIRRADLADIYQRLSNKPSVARALHAALRKMFRWAMSGDDLKHSPVNGVEAPPAPRPRDRYLTSAELSAAWATSFRLHGDYGALFRLLILTGQRRGEVVGLTWSELSREEASWHLPAARSKNRCGHLIPLSAASIAVLDSVAGDDVWPTDGLVLRSSQATPLSAFSKIKIDWEARIAKVLRAARGTGYIAPWRIHDLRGSVATGMQTLQIRTEIIEAVLNHLSGVRGGLVGVYQRYDFQAEKRQAMNAWGEHVLNLARQNNQVTCHAERS